jgi:hypothetical protein
MRWRMDKSSSLGMSPQETPKKYKHQSLGMPPRHPLLHQQKSGHLSKHYIFIASCIMHFSWSVSCFWFQFSFCFVYCNKWFDHIMLLWREMNPFFITKNTLVFTLIVQRVFSFSATAFSFRFLPWFMFWSCYIFLSRYIFASSPYWFSSKELFIKSLNGVGKEKKLYAKNKWYKKELV